MRDIRVGHGYDVHAFTEGNIVVLGGLPIPFFKALEGHSDADVLLHAICDALLGALALGDIGRWFPPSDPAYANIDSRKLFRPIWAKVKDLGWELVNLDSVVIAEAPKLSPFIGEIRSSIAHLFACDVERISVKATTHERLGALGRGEGIATSATVLLAKN